MNKVVEQDISSEFAEAEVDRDVDTDAAPTDGAEKQDKVRGGHVKRLGPVVVSWPARLSTKARNGLVRVLAALVIAGAGGLGYVWFATSAATTEASAGQSALASARTDIPKLLSYDYRTVDTALPEAAETMLTGRFLDEYTQLGESVIQPAAKKEQIVTNAEVVDAALVASDADHATVLLFVNQTTSKKDAEGPRLDGSRIRVQMAKDGDRWKISEFTPV
ncbi:MULTISPECIES: hypothetical protein [Gordonia]|jgi:Mce-associated membrane protein|uniref:Mce-associated membrane protein n=6 Tax=Gordonia TaxID=2053 RepID=A0AAW6RHB2_GORRU|nr:MULTISPECIES: hypothetical protein [Gordonia]MDY6808779.1 hypothetical protein [Actinomycetota bacterium]ASR04996.1 hypothetical protein GCWB2_21120 [Gordonia rubripertincta]EON30469.1 putative membrane protein [Gordonia terrae C-6]MAU84326.1 hypothetical protein [Gordonia sp. (in: high G+C Gram-positive bacteria)]MCR8900130.1 hypothetical protein [Gordonia sp. GONU]